ncbi:MAG: prolyl oligopeptidase family serine peptidase [Myxococcota bacterium]
MWTIATLAHAVEPDPYLWLEEVEGPKALRWVDKRNKASERELVRSPEFAPLRDRLLSIMNSDAKIPTPSVMGDQWYNFWQDGAHVQGVWRRTTRASYATAAPEWETVLDLDALSAAEGKRWVWHGAQCLPPEYRRCLLSLSDGGSDADVKREFDLVDKQFVDGGFTVPEAKSEVAWIDQDTLFVGFDWGEGSMTESGYPRQVRRWKRGTPLAQAELVDEGAATDMYVVGWVDHNPGYERAFLTRVHTFFSSETWWLDGEHKVHLDVPGDAEPAVWKDWLLVSLRSDWSVNGTTWPAGSLLVTRFDAFLAGGREFQPLFVPSARHSLEGYSVTRDAIVVASLDNVRSRIAVHTPTAGGVFGRSDIAGLSEFGSVSVWAVDSDTSNEVFATVTDFVTPSTLRLGSAEPGAPAPVVLKSSPAMFDATGLEVTQHEATSADGTRVPYFQVARADLALDGKRPTVVEGYGGFEISLTPGYDSVTGAAWLERGGVYVVANIRGGGEFGPSWHQAALKQDRHKAYEDFAAISQDLIDRRITSPEHLGALGGSNGGLLMGNMAMGWPKLYGAIVCQVPLLDMSRYTKLLAGASWEAEYGDPDDPEQWKFIQTFSPYHLVREGVEYPRILFTTSTRDDRVHPGHARKMAAKMLAQKHDILYWENTEGGHGGAANAEQRAKMWALAFVFLWNELQ